MSPPWRNLLFAQLLMLLCGVAAGAGAYEFPISDRFAASIVGTPAELQAKLPAEIPVETYTLPGIKEVPDVFWYQKGLKFSLAKQDHRAPLVFLVAGTGAAYDSAKNVALQKALYAAGFHVLNLPSSTHFNFIVNASTTSLTGFLPDDVRDLYRVMEQAWARVRGEVEVSDFMVGGYSLGGISAAFLAHHDETARSFGFKRVLMINPPVDLYNSVQLLDGYLDDNLKVGQGGAFLDEVIHHVAMAYKPEQGMRLDEDFVYRAYRMDRQTFHNKSVLVGDSGAALVGVSFRISSSAMLFSGDVMSHSGYIAPPGKHYGRGESLEYYAWASAQVPFTQYVDQLLLPTVMKEHPGHTREQLLRAASLKSIEQYLRTNDKIWAFTNADEIILAPGEIDYLRSVLGDRVRVYPRGGHCGNITHRDNVRDMIAVFRGEPLPAGV